MAGSRLDTSYPTVTSTQGVRSPRTPTYQPESPLICGAVPFDPAKFLNETISKSESLASALPPPSQPMAWIWICHLCHSRYALGVTRRCLLDGHYYCSGETDFPSLRKKKKNKSCTSEFDYGAWKDWGEWRRKALKILKEERLPRGCEQCDFPSQCRYPTGSHPLGEIDSTTKLFGSKSTRQCKDEPRGNGSTKSVSNENIDFDQILQSMLPETDLDKQETTKPSFKNPAKQEQRERGGKLTRKATGKKKAMYKGLVPSLEEEMAREERKLRELVGLDLWTSWEDIELEKAKIE